MTTFNYRFDLNDSERIALERALQIAIAHCDAEIKRGVKCPNISIKETCADLLGRLHSAQATQMSSYHPPMLPIELDESLPQDTFEIRDKHGKVVARRKMK